MATDEPALVAARLRRAELPGRVDPAHLVRVRVRVRVRVSSQGVWIQFTWTDHIVVSVTRTPVGCTLGSSVATYLLLATRTTW